jgi:hypothetical protein
MGQLSGVGFKSVAGSSPCADASPQNANGRTKITPIANIFFAGFILNGTS